MLEQIRFEIPGHVSDADLEGYIATNRDKYLLALDQTANEHDKRSVVDSTCINKVVLTDHDVTIEYTVHYSAYHGCKDQNYADSDDRELVGSRKNRVLIFDKFDYSQPRTTFEEF